MPVSKTSTTTSTKTKASAKKTTSIETTATAAPETSTTTATAAPETSTETSTTPIPSPVQVRITQLQTVLTSLMKQMQEVNRELTGIQKEYTKERRGWLRQQAKLDKKKAKSNKGVLHQSGIAKPGYISKALCTFIGVTNDTKMARTEVIKYINKYIKEHQLQDSTNKKVIVPDAKLQKLLQSDPKKDEVTYFNLQTFMKPHYADPSKAAATVSA